MEAAQPARQRHTHTHNRLHFIRYLRITRSRSHLTIAVRGNCTARFMQSTIRVRRACRPYESIFFSGHDVLCAHCVRSDGGALLRRGQLRPRSTMVATRCDETLTHTSHQDVFAVVRDDQRGAHAQQLSKVAASAGSQALIDGCIAALQARLCCFSQLNRPAAVTAVTACYVIEFAQPRPGSKERERLAVCRLMFNERRLFLRSSMKALMAMAAPLTRVSNVY